MANIVSLGEPLMEFSQIPGTTHYTQGFGGDTSTFAIAAARAGASAAYLTRVGEDAFGQQFLDLWRREGVDVGAVDADADAPTGLYFITHDSTGHVFSYRRAGSAATRMRFGAGFKAAVAGARLLHVSGISQAISPGACDCVFEAIECARAHGVLVSYDLNFRPRLWPAARARAIARATIAQADVFLPSMDEARVLFGIDDPQAVIAWAHDAGARRVALKMGAGGALVSDGQGVTAVPAPKVDAVDATGAGDCFAGVLAARLIAGDPLVQAARAACTAAAISTTGFGAVDPLPTWADVMARMTPAA